ncbi:hypothetical protein AYI69_g135 [Smittium culicis]|uniref:Uncharacterized protein n=1 Tax=Smittium culicis TaxID=133412 RepID=A0A1R1YTX0_9FUNG|nr:hypothetical protein AYI69_g135 [Smittium culicis]
MYVSLQFLSYCVSQLSLLASLLLASHSLARLNSSFRLPASRLSSICAHFLPIPAQSHALVLAAVRVSPALCTAIALIIGCVYSFAAGLAWLAAPIAVSAATLLAQSLFDESLGLISDLSSIKYKSKSA